MSSKNKEHGLMWNDFLLNGIRRRVGVLVVAALIGGKFLAHIFASNWWFCWFPVGTHDALAHVVAAAPFTVPTFIALWWFRTYDSRQQLQRANFEAGVGFIVSDTPISIEVGTQILLEVSKVTCVFDREIRLTFIKRLKRPVADTGANTKIKTGGYRFGYAQHMFRWMIARGGKWDLRNMALQHQEFTFKDITLKHILELSDFEKPIPEHFPVNLAVCRFGGDMTEELFFKGYDGYQRKYNNPHD